MYIPAYFQQEQPALLRDFIARHSFATFITHCPNQLHVSHVNLIAENKDDNRLILIGHLARLNPHAQHLTQHPQALAVFTGAHAYISPKWYSQKNSVPTWNYTAVHAEGRIEIMQDQDELKQALDKLILQNEKPHEEWYQTWKNGDYHSLLTAIVGFKLIVSDIQGKFKLSQNKSLADQRNIIKALHHQQDAFSQEIAEMMQRNLSHE